MTKEAFYSRLVAQIEAELVQCDQPLTAIQRRKMMATLTRIDHKAHINPIRVQYVMELSPIVGELGR